MWRELIIYLMAEGGGSNLVSNIINQGLAPRSIELEHGLAMKDACPMSCSSSLHRSI